VQVGVPGTFELFLACFPYLATGDSCRFQQELNLGYLDESPLL